MTLSARQESKYREYLAALRSEMPARYRVRVKRERERLPGKRAFLYGSCVLEGRTFVIRIHPTLRLFDLCETLAHEWAHARSWWAADEEGSVHTSAWGVENARAIRILDRLTTKWGC